MSVTYGTATIRGEWESDLYWTGFKSVFPPNTIKLVEYHANLDYEGSGAAIGVTVLGPFTSYQDAYRALGYEREHLPEVEPQ